MSNDLNYKAYSQQAAKYMSHNPEGTTGGLTPELRVQLFQQYQPNGKVFEIGSGAGLDALALQRAGYDVTASDFVPSFLQVLTNLGLRAIQFDAKVDEIPSDLAPLDGVYANAVFVHFSPQEFTACLQKFYTALAAGGHILFSVIQGSGHEISGRAKGIEREFYYYSAADIRKPLAETGFVLDVMNENIDEKWLHVVAHRPV